VSGITSISLDHQEFLGDDERSIAREKAGILKPGVPGVIGPLSDAARVAVYEVARERGVNTIIEATRLYRPDKVRVTNAGTVFEMTFGDETRTMTTGLTGMPQASNTAVALSMLRAAGGEWTVSLDDAAPVLERVMLPGRFQRIGNLILDVAHNADGMNALVQTLATSQPARPVTAILGVLGDKDWKSMITSLASEVDRLIVVEPPSAPESRAWDGRHATQFAIAKGVDASFDNDFAHAIVEAQSLEGTVLITGSFHTVGDALQILGEKTL
jgi:dihydrofolate synthase/folylpolyglutamate synthase